ncbi:phosphotransferase family protein [Pseudohalioglobus sediminis]|uniref:Phosphotransferase family protein n=1 Tax=Pseudohalioglobus sediminis TaxID=2606449 RepID=A0A5B0WZ96_9GAMM|nr:phosphotransferase family protein [Pseudohalioglobus sediminis]KAA1192373.1 phosphotransferase family protein [Pseudohalioglobus sediminis]
MSATDKAFASWAQSELGLQDARIDRELSGGNSNLTRMVCHSEGQLVMRSAPANTISPKAHLGVQREAAFMSALAGHAPVPSVLAWCEDTSVIGQPFALIEYIDGIALTEELPPTYDPGNAVNQLGLQLAEALGKIACAPWQELGLADMGRPENFLRRQIERWLKVRREQPTRDLPDLPRLGEWLLANLPEAGPVGIVHGDYHLDNTLCHRQRPELLAVIDWEMGTIGDPLTDLGLLLMFWGPRKVSPPGFAHVQGLSRCEGVTGRRELAQAWSRASGLPLQNLDFYLCFAFWRLAAIVEGAYGLYLAGRVDTDYARGLEYDVPALLREAAMAAEGEW